MRLRKPAQKQAYLGWLLWAPVILPAFAVLMFDAWMNVQIRKNDYELSRLNRMKEEVVAAEHELRVQMASWQELDQLKSTAQELGLNQPRPEQIVRLAFNPEHYAPAGAPTPDNLNATPRKRLPRLPLEVAKTTEVESPSPAEVAAPTEKPTRQQGFAAVQQRFSIAREVETIPAPVIDATLENKRSTAQTIKTSADLDNSLDNLLEKF